MEGLEGVNSVHHDPLGTLPSQDRSTSNHELLNARLMLELDETKSQMEELRIDNKRLQAHILQMEDKKNVDKDDVPDLPAQTHLIAALRTELTTAVTDSEQYKYEARMAIKELEEVKKRQGFLTAAHERLHTECEELRRMHNDLLGRLDEKEALLANAREKLRESSSALVKAQSEQREHRRRSTAYQQFNSNATNSEDANHGLKALRLGTTPIDEAHEIQHRLRRPAALSSTALSAGSRDETEPQLHNRPGSPSPSTASAQSGSHGMNRTRSHDQTIDTTDASSLRDLDDLAPVAMARKNSELVKKLAESEESRKAGEVCLRALRAQLAVMSRARPADQASEEIKLPPLPSEEDEQIHSTETEEPTSGLRSWKLPSFGGAPKSTKAVNKAVAPTYAPAPTKPNVTSSDSGETSSTPHTSTITSPFSTMSHFFGLQSTSPLQSDPSIESSDGSLSTQRTPIMSSRVTTEPSDATNTDSIPSPTMSNNSLVQSPSLRARTQGKPVLTRVGSWFSTKSPTPTESSSNLGQRNVDKVSEDDLYGAVNEQDDMGHFHEVGL